MLRIDKNSYKILQIIYQHRRITKDQLKCKTRRKPEAELNHEISVLLKMRFIYNPETGTDEFGNIITDSDIFCISQDGKVYVESCIQDERRWRIPVIISTIALIFSGLALAKSFGLLELLPKILGRQ